MNDGRRIKCVAWDLDDTIWQGTLAENQNVALRSEAARVIRTLDERGILNSVASMNDYESAMAKLREVGLADYFVYPQIGWDRKSFSLLKLAQLLRISPNAIALVDDEPYQRAEVSFEVPDILCLDASNLVSLLERPDMTPGFVTTESRTRRLMYQAEEARARDAETFVGPKDEFLRSLDMRLEIGRATESDLMRASELTLRTHQLNSTGYLFSHDELDSFRQSDRHILLTAQLTDRFGPYGTVGLGLIEKSSAEWMIRLLLLSCRVMNRGITPLFLACIKRMARDAGTRLLAEVKPTKRNRVIYISFLLNGFSPSGKQGDVVRLEADLSVAVSFPGHVSVLAQV